MKIIFMGTPEFAVDTFVELHKDSTHEIVAIYTAPPKNAARGLKVLRSKIHEKALELGYSDSQIFTPKTLRGEENCLQMQSFAADIAVVAAYGLLLPQAILDTPKYGCINIHPSLLPKYRGASPIQAPIINGDEVTGVTIMQMAAGLDSGDIILQQKVDIAFEGTAGEMHDILAKISANMTLVAIDSIKCGTAKFVKQDDKFANYAAKITPEDEILDFSQDALILYNKIRGMSPYPAMYFYFLGKKYKIFQANYLPLKDLSEVERNNYDNYGYGQIIGDKMLIKCYNGCIRPSIIQKEGKKKLDLKDFLNGNSFAVGDNLSH